MTISPAEARRRIEGGAVLVDIREADEHAREHIEGARHLPLSRIRLGARLDEGRAGAVIWHCGTGARTLENADLLAAAAPGCEAFVVAGGIDAWRGEGLPTRVDRRQPLPLMRQVQITAGSLVLLGVVLGYLVSPWLFLLSGFVGAGLVFAGITGWCGMTHVLRPMPWNRPPRVRSQAPVRA